MLSLEVRKDNVNQKLIETCISSMVRLYKEDLDAKLMSWTFRFYKEDYELLERLLAAKDMETAVEEMRIISFICGGDPEIDPGNSLVLFYEYIVRVLYLSEFEPDKLCLRALNYLQGGLGHCWMWPREVIQIEIHKDIKQEVLQRVSAEMKPYIQKQVLGTVEVCESSERLAKRIIEEIMKIAIIKKPRAETNEINP